MNWIHIVYLLVLIFLANKMGASPRRASFRAAWITFALIPFWQFLMHLCRLGNVLDPRALQLIEIWDQAIPSLLLGISFLCLLGVLAPQPPVSGGNDD